MTEPQQASDLKQADPPPDPGPASGPAGPVQGSTAWTTSRSTPLRNFLRTETGSATILASATLAALIWCNVAGGSFDTFWNTRLSVNVASHAIAMDLHEFVNSGLMALFFLVVGLEARREWDMGELRVRSRVTLPFLVGLGGMLVPIAISVVDDLLGLAIIAIFYSSHVRWLPLLIGALLLAAVGILTRRGLLNGPALPLLGIASWVAFFESGVDPIVSGLVIGLMTCAYPAARETLEQATETFREFREQPTARLAAEARQVVRGAISPNERLQERYHGLTAYVIVPLFALANADVKISGSFLAHAYTSPATLGIMIGYIAGKPVGTAGTAWLVSRVTRGRLKPPVGWGSVIGVGAVAGIGFTVALLISSLAFNGPVLAEAKLGVLSGAVCATGLTAVVFHGLNLFSPRTRLRALLGTSAAVTDLAVPVDPERDHLRGPKDGALITLVEYGDFECPYCGQAEPAVRALIQEYSGFELRFVFRHLPLTDVHPHAQMAAEAAEAAARQGKFWEMHDTLMDHQGALTVRDLIGYAGDLGLDVDKFTTDVRKHVGAGRIAEDIDSADLATVSGTPTFFINGNRYYGAFDLAALKEAVHAAKLRAIAAA
jgi:Na+/H+ antiporter NhaA/protein-disulfide isomerase